MTTPLPRAVQVASALVSLVALAVLIAVLVVQDVRTLAAADLRERLGTGAFTSPELGAAWLLIGVAVFSVSRRRRHRSGAG